MSFQGYLDNIETRTGRGPDQFRAWGIERGFSTGQGLAPGIKAGAIVVALKDEFGLGHGHAMAIVALLKGKKVQTG
jgi:hypothetical protein